MLLSLLTLIPLGVSRSTWKSADPVQTHMEVTLRGEEGCVVAAEVTTVVQELAREGEVSLVEDEEAT